MAERFDIYDEDGRPLGTATREEAHARGLWHQTFHCWLVRRGERGEALVLFQQRSASKDTNPGCFDITVAGHLAAGETVRDAAREMDEEIGWSVPFEQLVPFGTVREEGEGVAGGKAYIDREISHVYGCVTAMPLAAFRLQREEVSGIYEAEAGELIALMTGEAETAGVRGLRFASGKAGRDGAEAVVSASTEPGRKDADAMVPAAATVRAADFVPRDFGYYIRVFRLLRELAANGSSPPSP